MALVLTTTVAGETSNSYASLEEAAAYFEACLNFTALWTAFTEQQKFARLITATRSIDRFKFIGSKIYYTQALEHPRNAVNAVYIDPNFIIDPTVIDTRIKHAQLEMVMFNYFNADATTGQIGRDISSVSIDGVLSVDFDQKPSGVDKTFAGNFETIKALLEPWLVSSGFRLEK